MSKEDIEIEKAILTLLGLGDRKVKSLELTLEVGKPPFMVVSEWVDIDVGAGASVGVETFALKTRSYRLQEIPNSFNNKVSFVDVANAVKEVFLVTVSMLRSRSLYRVVADARMVTMYLLRTQAGYTYKDAAKAVDRTHGAAIHACKQVEQLAAQDKTFWMKLEQCKELILR